MEEQQNQFINKFVDILFSKNNFKYLIMLFILAFTLRAIVANNVSPNADEMLHAPHAINFIDSGKLQIMDQDPIWFFLTDLSYKIFGVNLFAARFLAVLFGSLSLIVLYLIIKLIYNKELALISSTILTFSSFHILMSLAEMDVAMMFFVLLSIFFFIKALKEKNEKYLVLCYLFLGIAILTKQIAITFIPVFIISYIYYKLKCKEKINFKQVLTFILVMFVVSLPVLTFNYLLYKDKGLVDLQFSRFFGVAKETYKPIEATIQPFSLERLIFSSGSQKPGFVDGISFFWSFDKIIFILGIIGFLIALLKKKDYLLLFSLSFLIPFIFLSGTSLLEYHFIFGVPILALFSGIFLDFIGEKVSKFKIEKNAAISVLLILIVIFNFSFVASRGIFNKSEITKIMSYSKDNIEQDSLVIVDSRIYRGRIAWAFNDRHYLEAANFPALVNQLNNFPGESKPIKTYFIECVTDDCGWGTINSQPDFNSSMESIADFFKNNSDVLKTITTRTNEPYFNVYSRNLLLKNSVLDVADSTHEWFYYPLRYQKESFDDYKTKGFGKFLNVIAHIVLYIEALIALLSIALIFYILIKDEKPE